MRFGELLVNDQDPVKVEIGDKESIALVETNAPRIVKVLVWHCAHSVLRNENAPRREKLNAVIARVGNSDLTVLIDSHIPWILELTRGGAF